MNHNTQNTRNMNPLLLSVLFQALQLITISIITA